MHRSPHANDRSRPDRSYPPLGGPPTGSAHPVLALQRTAGNAAITRLVRRTAPSGPVVQRMKPGESSGEDRTKRFYLALDQNIRMLLGKVRLILAGLGGAIGWIENRLAAITAIARLAAELPGETPRLVVRLILALYRPLANRGLSDERIELSELAVATAHRIGDRRGEAQVLEDLGTICNQVGLLPEAVRHIERAMALWQRLGDPAGKAACLTGVGAAHRRGQRPAEAVAWLERGLTASRTAGWAVGEAGTLNQLGLAYQALGRFEPAMGALRDSAAVHRRLRDRGGEGIALANLGWAYQRSRRPAEAAGYHQAALDIFEAVGDRYNEAEQLWALAQVAHELGEDGAARTLWRRSAGRLVENKALSPGELAAVLASDVPATPEIIRLNT